MKISREICDKRARGAENPQIAQEEFSFSIKIPLITAKYRVTPWNTNGNIFPKTNQRYWSGRDHLIKDIVS